MEYQMNEISFLISVARAERELLHSTSLPLAIGRSIPPYAHAREIKNNNFVHLIFHLPRLSL